MVAKCAPRIMHHWAHASRRDCDPWRENETQWHRNWKALFPEDCREIHHVAPNGEIHRPYIKTRTGIYIEVQHSAMSDAEHIAREDFYQNLVSIIDGPHRYPFHRDLNWTSLAKEALLSTDQRVLSDARHTPARSAGFGWWETQFRVPDDQEITTMAKATKKTATPKSTAKPKPTPKTGKQPSKANPDKKSAQILQLLRRQQGATINELSIATTWQPHSVRGFLSGTIKKRYGLKLASEVIDGTRHYRVPA